MYHTLKDLADKLK